MSATIRTALALGACLALAACRSPRPLAEELALAQEEIDSGSTADGARRMADAYEALGERDPLKWNRLGEVSAKAASDVATRAFDRAEALLWPDPSPRVRLSLPFDGRWRVTQGNRGAFSHRRLADRFAWDFQRVDEHDAPSRGGDGPAAFVGFGAPVLAPADGVVARAEDGVPDNTSGERNYAHPGGNVIVLRIGDAEFVHFCHLQNGSVAVRPGQTVRRGDVIALCGCSGNAIEPHLHFVVRAGTTSEDASIPAAFDDAGPAVPAAGELVGRRLDSLRKGEAR